MLSSISHYSSAGSQNHDKYSDSYDIWVSIKELKYHVIPDIAGLRRMSWYFYYISLLFIPTLDVLLALALGKSEKYRLPKWTNLLFLFFGVLVLLVLTNDFHNLVFIFPAGEALSDSVYAYNIAFWFVLSWQILLGISAIAILTLKCRIPQSKNFFSHRLFPLLLQSCTRFYMQMNKLRFVCFLEI